MNEQMTIDKDFKITRAWLAGLKFQVMTERERRGFMGCEHPVPLLAEGDNFVAVLDGDRCEVFLDEFGTVITYDNVRNLA
jgi:hypothetical protein